MSAERFPCCVCCPDDDSRWHAENPKGTHEVPCPTCERMTEGQVRAEAEVDRLREGIGALHRPVLPVFSWRDGLRFDEPCPECHGKAGVHSCGCWSDEDAEFVCFECSRPSSSHLRRDIPWPCATAALLDGGQP